MPRSEGGSYTEDEWESVEAHVQALADFRNQVIAWRNEPVGNSMAAEEVIGKTEMVFNLYQSHPAMGFEEYESYEHEIPVSSNAEWTPSQVVAFYDNVKSLAIQAVGSGANRKMHFLSLSNRYENEGNTVVRALIHVGVNPIEELEELSEDLVRWAAAPKGHTPVTPCTGAADDTIGSRVNGFLGVYYAKNSRPGTGNNPLPGRIVSRIVWGVHKLFPLPYDPPIPYPKMYDISTYNTPLQSWHYNSVTEDGTAPPWNCLDSASINFFFLRNIDMGNSAGLNYVPAIIINGVKTLRNVVCTRVRGDQGGWTGSDTKWQEHIVEHYFGLVQIIVVEDREEIRIDEM